MNGNRESTTSGGTGHTAPRPRVTSLQLFGASKEIVIDHGGQEYRLRITSNDKLILTK